MLHRTLRYCHTKILYRDETIGIVRKSRILIVSSLCVPSLVRAQFGPCRFRLVRVCAPRDPHTERVLLKCNSEANSEIGNLHMTSPNSSLFHRRLSSLFELGV